MRSPKVKILIVSSGLRPEHFGGLPSHVEDLLVSLSAAGEQVAYLNVGAKSTWPLTQLSKRGDLPCPAWNLTSPRSYVRYWTGTKEPDSQVVLDAGYERAFHEVIEVFQPGIVHFHELTSVPVGIFEKVAANGIKLLFSAHDFFALCPTAKLFRPDGTHCDRTTENLDCQNCSLKAGLNRFQQWGYTNEQVLGRSLRLRNVGRRVIRWLEKSFSRLPETQAYQRRRQDFIRMLSFADAVLVTSRAQERLFQQHTGDQWRLRFLPLSRSTFRKDRPLSRMAAVRPNKLIFIALNIVNQAKGLDLLKSTFAKLAEEGIKVELRLVGLEPGTNPGIRTFGPYNDEQLDDILAEADFGILPSIWPEAYGYVGPEMLSRGLPVIASKMGAMPDYVIDGENGLLFDPKVEGDLASKIRTLISDTVLQKSLWEGAADGERKYLTMAEHMDALLRIYQEIIK
jgi:glycosyltransferase involved in cell wall biosynthesis